MRVARCILHLVAASRCIALPLPARQSARPTLASCCLDSVGATLLPLLLIRERRERSASQPACLGPALSTVPSHLPIYPSICLSAPARLGVASLSPSFLLCLPAYCCYLPTYYYSYHYSILALLPSPLLPIHHTTLHPLPPSALRADKVPRSHSTALAPCIGPARVNTAQSALDPDPLAFCSASRPLLHHQPTLRP